MRALFQIPLLCAGLSGFILMPLSAGVAQAQEGDAEASRAEALIELVRQRPSGKDRDEWREERREAARELGTLGDKRAVPVLIQVVKSEQFDAVGEIAIVSLGKLGDESAIPVLQEVAKDSSRDRFVRKAARAALRKLGAKVEGAGDDEGDKTEELASTGLSNYSLSSGGTGKVALAPAFGDDMLAASDHLTFAVGQSHLEYDTVTKEGSLDGEAFASYLRIREKKSMALRYEGRGSVIAGVVNYQGDDSSARLISTNAGGSAQARFYTASGKWFGLGSGSGLIGFDYLRIKRPGGGNITNEKFLSAELGLAIGGGYGRIYDYGEALRVKRIESVLRKRKMLGRAIGPDLGERIMRAWWELRNEQGFHDRLVATVAQLREAGVLLGEPDAGATYAILQVLRDGQLSNRQRGLQVHLAVGESYLVRDEDLNLEDGRVESVVSRAHYGRQNADGDQELRVDGFARYRILADDADGDPSPWSLTGVAHWRDFHYGDNLDPIGALDIGVTAGASDDGFMGAPLTTNIGGSVGWLWVPSRASRFLLAGQGRYESGELFLGVLFEGQYGLIDAGYVGSAGH
jgi:hypothetical protein